MSYSYRDKVIFTNHPPDTGLGHVPAAKTTVPKIGATGAQFAPKFAQVHVPIIIIGAAIAPNFSSFYGAINS